MGILNESQLDRDIELSKILIISLEKIQKLEIASKDAIRVSDGVKPDNLEDLYHDYEHLNFPAYLKTLMKTSATRRHPELFKFLNQTNDKVCLDFGSGVGTHAIALLEKNNRVDLLDVPGKLSEFASQRVIHRKYFTPQACTVPNNYNLHDNRYDIVICSDCLEHVSSPMKELQRIYKAMKKGGLLHLLVSTMVKPSSGHFQSSIDEWLTQGKIFMAENFTEIRPTIYRKD